MTGGSGHWGCEACSADLPELALGVLTGRERARALAHVDACPRCADQLEQLTRAADTVLLTAPVQEPPMGFEVRLFDRMGVRAVTRGRRRLARTPRLMTATVASAAAAVAALGVGLGVTLSSSQSPTAPVATPAPAPHMQSANLVANGHTVGHVMFVNGTKPWMSMMLADSGAHDTFDRLGTSNTLKCVVVDKDGVTHTVGTLVAKDGYGAWYAPLRVNPDHLRAAKVVSPSGAVIATAALS
jgi:hypothetical protein